MLIFYSYIQIWKNVDANESIFGVIYSMILLCSTYDSYWHLTANMYLFLKRKKKIPLLILLLRYQEGNRSLRKWCSKIFNNLKDSFRFDSFNIRCTSNVEWKVIHTRTAYCIRKLFYAHIVHNQLYHSCLKGHQSTVSQNYFQMLPAYHCKNRNRRNLVLLC